MEKINYNIYLIKKIESDLMTINGKQHLNDNELEAALDSLYHAVRLNPKNMEAPYYMAKTFIKMGMPKGALESIEIIYKNL